MLVTGGTRGIGAAISRRFLAGGWKTLVTARSRQSYEPFAHALRPEEEKRVEFLVADFGSDESAAELAGAIQGFHRLDALVNNAGDNVNNTISELPRGTHEAAPIKSTSKPRFDSCRLRRR